ncbi:hypothetical protein [Caldifermentibacillus hisashii]|uniref:hypothetical protein n=1 Tax=Caldifermentibacillus hisashii TaxID=996558 RepID=UPI001C0F577B|nr:hypothetical protein [Caldifermentibacillus hisashii]MBU5342281.1 hypothetical protein [Caldifermentibacillus hisashii]
MAKEYKKSFVQGEVTINQLREKEGLKPISDGDKYIVGVDYTTGKDFTVEV